MSVDAGLRALIQLHRGPGSRVGAERIELLEAIAREGSISAAARTVGLSYKGAWDAVQALNNLYERPLVLAKPGGRAGGAASVSPTGLALVAAFRRLESELSAAVSRLGEDDPTPLLRSLAMKTSARNALAGVVSQVRAGAVSCEVTLEVSPRVSIVAMITQDSARELALEPGRRAIALIKSSFVILAPGAEPLRTSARNCLGGTVLRRERGAVNDEIVLEIDEGKTITATITSTSADALGLEVGAPAQALIKAPHVILAVD